MADSKKIIKKLRAELAERDKIIATLLERIAVLEEKIKTLEKNSANSSKPPSSDIVKPAKIKGETATKKSKRKIGAQPGRWTLS